MKKFNQFGKVKIAIGLWIAVLMTGLVTYKTVQGAPSGTVAVVNTYGQETPGASGQGIVTPVIVAFVPVYANTLTPTPTFTYSPTQTYSPTTTTSNTPAAGTNTWTPTLTYTPTFTYTSTFTAVPTLTSVNTPVPPTPIINMAEYTVTLAGVSSPTTVIFPAGFAYTALGINLASGTGVTVVAVYVSGGVTTLGTALAFCDSQVTNTSTTVLSTTNDSYFGVIMGMQGYCLQPNGAVSLTANALQGVPNVPDCAGWAAYFKGVNQNSQGVPFTATPTITPTGTCPLCTGTPTPTLTFTSTPTPTGSPVLVYLGRQSLNPAASATPALVATAIPSATVTYHTYVFQPNNSGTAGGGFGLWTTAKHGVDVIAPAGGVLAGTGAFYVPNIGPGLPLSISGPDCTLGSAAGATITGDLWDVQSPIPFAKYWTP